MDEILLNKTQKVSASREASEFRNSDYDDNCLYQDEKMSLEETKEKLNWSNYAFEYKQNNSYGI